MDIESQSSVDRGLGNHEKVEKSDLLVFVTTGFCCACQEDISRDGSAKLTAPGESRTMEHMKVHNVADLLSIQVTPQAISHPTAHHAGRRHEKLPLFKLG
jgi:hypothetical protein